MPLGPTIILKNVDFLIQKGIYLQLYFITIYTKMGLLPIIPTKYHNTREGRFGHFFDSKVPDASHPQVRLQYLKNIVPRRGEQSPVVEFPYLGYSPPKCNAMAHQHTTHANISLMHILTISIPYIMLFSLYNNINLAHMG